MLQFFIELLYTTDKKEKKNRQVICNMFGQVNRLNTKLQISSQCFLKRQLTIFRCNVNYRIFPCFQNIHCLSFIAKHQDKKKKMAVPDTQRLVSQFL